MSFALFSLVVASAAIMCDGLLGAGVIIAARRSVNAWLIGALCLGSICHQLLAWQEFSPFEPVALRLDVGGWAPILNIARNLAPGLFMVLVHRLFVDDRRLPHLLWAVFGLQLVLEVWVYRHLTSPLAAAPALLQVLFGALALYWTLALWRGDLIETRRRMRAVVFVVLTVNMVASSLLLRIVKPSGTASYYVHELLSILGLATVLLLLVRGMRMDASAFADPARRPAVAPPIRRSDDDLMALQALERLIGEDRIFLRPGLSQKALADRIGVPEYRLRRMIHERLGYRNFSAFLHSQRIAEACRWLDDPKTSHLPILTVALSVGYNSANTFNRGFKDVMGRTPSDYRSHSNRARGPKPEKPIQILQST